MQNRKRNRETDLKTAEQNYGHNLKQPISSMPDDKKVYLAENHLGAGSSYNLFRAVPALFQSIHPSKAQLESLRKLLSHAALGEWEQAEAIWSKDASLLMIPGTVYHPNRIYAKDKDPVDIPEEVSLGRYKYVNCTAWQIALMNEEWDEIELMGKHLSDEEKQKQFLEIFSDGEMQYSQKIDHAKKLLQKVFDAVIKDQSIDLNNLEKMSDTTKAALKMFRDYIKPATEHKTGLVFDPAIYLAALQLHDDHYDKFENLHQRDFWCIRVEEMIASVLGTGYLRHHAQGIGRNNHHRRGCLLSDGSSYFAFRRRFDSLASFNYFIGHDVPMHVCGVAGRGIGRASSAFQKLYREKTRERTTLYRSIRTQKRRHVQPAEINLSTRSNCLN